MTLATLTDTCRRVHVHGRLHTGATTANPTVNGQDLTWSGPFSVPGNGSVTLHFDVNVASTPGDYFNNATADAGSTTVVATGPTARSHVTSPQTATLHVIKHVVNDSGDSASAANFTLSVSGTSPSPASFPGAESPGTTVTLGAGSYSVSEIGPSGYTSSSSADCSGSRSTAGRNEDLHGHERRRCRPDDRDAARDQARGERRAAGSASGGELSRCCVSGTSSPSPASFAGADAPGHRASTLGAGSYSVLGGGAERATRPSFSADCAGSRSRPGRRGPARSRTTTLPPRRPGRCTS